MYTALSRDYLREPGFALFGRILRECVLDHWPVAPGETLIGEVVAERRLHSVATAAQEAGVGFEFIEPFLIEAGAVPEEDDRPPSRQVFEAGPYAELLAEIPKLVSPGVMREVMGATKSELKALEEEGLLIPRTRVVRIKNRWGIADGLALVADLAAGALPVAEDDRAWETLLHACRRMQVRLTDLVAAIRDGRSVVGRRAGVRGFHGLVLGMTDFDALPASRIKATAPLDVDLAGMTSAASFGRSVGLRDKGSFFALIEAGHVPAVRVVNPATGRLQTLPPPRGHRDLSPPLRDAHDPRRRDRSTPECPAQSDGRRRGHPLRARRAGLRARLSAGISRPGASLNVVARRRTVGRKMTFTESGRALFVAKDLQEHRLARNPAINHESA
jgi:hypothetical protein